MTWAKEVLQKYSVAIAVAMLMGIGTFVCDYFKRFFLLPAKVEAIEKRRIKDSTFAADYILKQENINKFLMEQILINRSSIDSIKNDF